MTTDRERQTEANYGEDTSEALAGLRDKMRMLYHDYERAFDRIRAAHAAEVERVTEELQARIERLEEAVKQSMQALEEADRALTAINKWCFNQGGGMITGHRARIFNYIGDRPEKCRTAIFNLKAIL